MHYGYYKENGKLLYRRIPKLLIAKVKRRMKKEQKKKEKKSGLLQEK